MSKPLEGVRVVELARVLAGPWAGQLLADLGADVIKIENPDGGDETRHWGPPFIKGANGEDLSAAYFHSANRGKRSAALDLKNAEHLNALKKLISTADVVIENYKVGGLKKFGLDYESLSKANPNLVYCSITGFGQTGPYAHRAGYDFIIQGMSGFMSITGEPDGQPMKAGVAITDILTGLYAVSAINAALVKSLKHNKGSHIDIALMEVMAASLANQNMNYLATGSAPARLGNAHPNIAPYQVIPVKDGHIILAVGNDGQFARLCEILRTQELAQNPLFATNQKRVENRDALTISLTATTTEWARDALIEACENHAVPVGAINTIEDMFNDPHVKARELQIATSLGVPGVRSPFLIDGQVTSNIDTAPALGADTQSVLNGLAHGWPARD
ncbi:CaiB/BaiF CoA-transferase family protein [Ahrensia sp. 13_GOM-1096m]|uniref:CaiB/BaiF CoA transferase family protein n=1 Tax=Ahrensia sp. 13_GOM-1096m TaxID=1380380 RepID=UPI00047BA8BC|nr:CaiB/BaiF CoA-transferase family protein [Ahrensia sp. 13_GOM-1096m]